ncbi:MAG: S8 family serine peptidase [Acidobacteriota bacterium]
MTRLSDLTSSLRLLLPLCFLVTATAVGAQDRTSGDVYFLQEALAEDGVSMKAIRSKIHPELLAQLELDAETEAKGGEAAATHSIVVSLRSDKQRRARLLAQKSTMALTALQQEVRDTQDRILGAVATKSRQGFAVRNRYKTLAGFSAYADLRAVAALALQKDVASVELMPVFESRALLDGNADETTDMRFAHAFPASGAGVTIAVIDSGIDYTHSRLGGGSFPNTKVIGGYDFGDNDADPRIDCNGDQHGTATAFIAAGDGGVAPGAKLVHLKVQSSSRCGTLTFDGDVEAALDWAITNQATYGIDIVSMSFGAGAYASECPMGRSYWQSLANAHAAGLLLVAASGNDGYKDKMNAPACHPDVMSVGAVYDRKFTKDHSWFTAAGSCKDKKPSRYQVACYSNSASFLDVLGPATCAKVAKAGGGIKDCFGGTSAAAPFVAGVAALALGINPALTHDNLRLLLSSVGHPTTDPANGLYDVVVNGNLAVHGAIWWPPYW